MPNTATTPELAELIRPFSGARLNRAVDPNSQYGAYLPRASAIDIVETAATRFDADVRRVSAAGVDVYFYDRCETVPWAAIRRITIASLDADGNRTAERTIEHVGTGSALLEAA